MDYTIRPVEPGDAPGIAALRRMPGRVFPQGSPRAAVTLPLLLSLILLLGSAFLPAL